MTASSAVQELLISNVWDERFGLPLVRMHLNPHIYCASTVRVLETLGPQEKEFAQSIRIDYCNFLYKCELIPGLILTYPSGGHSSHDDVYGASFLNSHIQDDVNSFASRVVIFLTKRDGIYSMQYNSESKNQFRFLYFLPSLKALAGFGVSVFFSQLAYALAVVFHAWTSSHKQMSGHHKLWLTFPSMMEYPIARAAIIYWEEKQLSRGLTPRKMFEFFYLKECPWFARWAPESWTK